MRLWLCSLLLAPSLAAGQDPQGASTTSTPGQPEHERATWYVGVGIARSELRIDTDEWSARALALDLEIGRTLPPLLRLGGSLTHVRRKAEMQGGSVEQAVSTATAVATCFPWRRGLFVRGGAGLARLTDEASGPGLVSRSFKKLGASLSAGVGYGFGGAAGARVTVNLDYARQLYAGDRGPSWSWTLPIGVTVYWY